MQDELGGRSDVIRNLEAFTRQVERQEKAVTTAKTRLDEYRKTLGENITDKQEAKLERLNSAYVNASKLLQRYQQDVSNTTAALRAAGVNTDDLKGSLAAIAEQQSRAAVAFNKVGDEIRDYAANIDKAREAARKLADEQSKLERFQRGNADDARLGRQQAADRARLLEQQASDDLLARQALGRSEAQKRQQLAAQSELAAIRDSEEFLRKYAEAKKKAAEQDAGLKKTADEAEKTARSYSTLVRASQDLRPRVVSLRDAIEAINNPAAAARRTLAGVESQIQGIGRVIASGGNGVKDYAEQFKNLSAAQKVISGQASLIDDFRNQSAALRQSRTAFVEARTEVAKYAAAVRAGGDAGAQFTKPLAEAQAKLKAAAAAMREQVQATRASREALRQAGIDSRNLADAQSRLVAATKQAGDALKALGREAENNGRGIEKAGRGFSLFRDEGRTTLSLAQRIRGEILALTTAYIGVQGAIGLAADSLKAYNQAQALASGLQFALGDSQRVGAEIQYLREQTERLGISFEQASKGYVKFAAAAVKSGASVQETRFIFEAFSEVARVINLTPDELNGLFNAIGQSFSKGKIQAEELRQQIGERLPGAFAFAQEALKSKFPDLNKALEEGKVGAENMLLIAESVRKAAQGGLSGALKSLDAEQQRFNNSVLFFKQQIADAGFADAYVGLIKQLTEYFRSTDGKEFAKTLSDIGRLFIDGVQFLIKYREEIGAIALVFAGVVTAGWIAKTGVAVSALASSFSVAAVAGAALAPIVLTLSSAFTALGVAVAAFIGGYSLGQYLRDQSREVRIFGIAIVTGFAELWSRIKFGAMELWEDLPRLAENALKLLINDTTQKFRDLLGIFQSGARALGLTSVADGIGKAIDALFLKYNTGVSSRVNQIRREAEADLKRIRDIGDQMVADEVGQVTMDQKAVRDRSDARLFRDQPLKVRPSTLPVDDSGAKKLKSEIEAIQNALEDLQSKSLKKQGEDLSALLAAIDKQYADLERRIRGLAAIGASKKTIADLLSTFRAGTDALKLETIKDYNEAILKEQEALRDKLEASEAAAGRKQKNDLQARLDAIAKEGEARLREFEALRAKIVQPDRSDTRFFRDGEGNSTDPRAAVVDQMAARQRAATLELQNLERVKFLREQLQQQEQSINDLLQARELAIKRINEAVTAGTLTRGQGDTQIMQTIAQFEPQIALATAQMSEFAKANAEAFDPNRLQEFLLKLEQARNSGKALNEEFNRTGQIISRGIDQGIAQGFDALYDSLVNLVSKTGDLGDVFENAGRAMLGVIAQVLRELALMYVKEQALIAIQAIRIAMSGGSGATFASPGVAVQHSGGLVGHSPNRTRRLALTPAAALAPRYHSGGMPGLAPDEYLTILQKNEEVLAKSDPRNIMNANKGQAQSADSGNLRVVLVDDRSRVAEAMNSPEGGRVVVQHIKANLPSIRQMLK